MSSTADTRRVTPPLRIGQRGSVSRSFILERGNRPPNIEAVNLSTADEVRLTTYSVKFGTTVVEDEPCTIGDPEAGEVEYSFDQTDTNFYGDHTLQFEIHWNDAETELIPPDGFEWRLEIGRRLAGLEMPFEVNRLVADSAVIEHLQVDSLAATDTIGTWSVDELVANTIDTNALDTDLLDGLSEREITSISGPGLSVDTEGRLYMSAAIDGVEGLTNPLLEHLDADGFDITNVGNLDADSAAVSSEPTAADDVVREQERSALESDIGENTETIGTLSNVKADREGDDLQPASVRTRDGPIDVTHDDYGADPSGNSDSTTAIQDAVTTAGDAGGGVVHIPEGDYYISDEIIGRSNVEFVGDGQYVSVIHQTDPSKSVITLGEGPRRENIRIAHLGITHDHGLAEQDEGKGIYSTESHVDNCIVENCYIHETARQAVALWGTSNTNIQLRNNHLKDIARDGLFCIGSGMQATGNYIDGTGDDAIAFNTDNTTDCLIAGNTVIDGAAVGEMTGGGIKIHGQNTSVIGNVVIDANSYGIRAHRNDGSPNDTVPRRNKIHGNLLYGLRNAPEGYDIGSGIETRETRSLTISNNSLFNMKGHRAIGIRNENNASSENNTVIKGNFIMGADSTVAIRNHHTYININNNIAVDIGRLVSMYGDADRCEIKDNSARRIDDYPVYLSQPELFSGTLFAKGNNVWTGTYDSFIAGQNDGAEIYDYLNRPSGSSTQSFIDDANSYRIIRYSDLDEDLTLA